MKIEEFNVLKELSIPNPKAFGLLLLINKYQSLGKLATLCLVVSSKQHPNRGQGLGKVTIF
jgi:hypothetical protein